MKTKNQSDVHLFDPSIAKAANEDGITPAKNDVATPAPKQDWSPYEVWRTRVKTLSRAATGDSAQI